MKNLKLIAILCIWCLLPVMAAAQFTETKELKKEFKVTEQTQIEITNKYGKIDIHTWDKDSVVFEINIRVEARKLSKLEDVVDGINFDITSNENFLILRTNVDKNKNSLGKELQRFKESILKDDGNIQVDYEVWMPDSNELKIENKFGDIYIGDYHGEVSIDLSNGNLKAHNFYNHTKLNLTFADASVNSMEDGQVQSNFSELYIKKTGSINLNSKSSEFEINEIRDLEAESRRDKFRIREAEMINAKSSFSMFRIDELSDRLTLRSEYGNLDLGKATADFDNILIESKSTDISMYFNESASFNFEITHTDSNLDLCDEMKITREELLDEKSKKVKLTGTFGSKKNDENRLNITAVSGEISIRAE